MKNVSVKELKERNGAYVQKIGENHIEPYLDDAIILGMLGVQSRLQNLDDCDTEELRDLNNELDGYGREIEFALEVRQTVEEHRDIDILMGDHSGLYAMCMGRHRKFVKALQEAYEDTGAIINNKFGSVHRSIKSEVIQLNTELGTKYTESFVVAILKIIEYEMGQINLRSNLVKEWSNVFKEAADTSYNTLQLRDLRTNAEITIHTARSLGVDILRLGRFIGDDDKDRWPYIPLMQDIKQSLADYKLNNTILKKLQMLGSDTYRNTDMVKALGIEAVRRALIQCENIL